MVGTRRWGVALGLLVAAGLAIAQDIHRWTDANGKVHFGDDAASPESSSSVTASRGNFVKTEKPKYAGKQPIASPTPDYAERRITPTQAPPPVIKSNPNVTIRTVQPSSVSTPMPAGQGISGPSSPSASPYVPAQVSRPATEYGKPASCEPVERDMVSPKSGMTIRVREYPCREGSIPVEVGKEESFWEKKESERQQRSLDTRTGRERQYLDSKGTLREHRVGVPPP
ncbi:MAG TPA: DUF4124 domain-containing protein [Moraxellaceae bacterium]